jgi:hypothetical protein
MSDLTTRSGRTVVVPTRLHQDAAYVEQLGPLRDHHKHPCKALDHVTKDAQIGRSKQSDRSFRRDVQNVHFQIIELAGEHSVSRAR